MREPMKDADRSGQRGELEPNAAILFVLKSISRLHFASVPVNYAICFSLATIFIIVFVNKINFASKRISCLIDACMSNFS